jgi:hypothetical protein
VSDDEATQPIPVPGPTPPAADSTSPRFAPPAASPVAPPPSTARRTGAGTIRSLIVGVVFVLTCLSLVLATTTWWLHDTVLDTDHFVSLTAPLVHDPAIQEALVTATADQLDEALGLGAVQGYVVTGIAREVYASDAFAGLWSRAMAGVHTAVVAILRGDSAAVQTADGKIVLNLFPLFNLVAQRVDALNLQLAGVSVTLPTLTNPDDPNTSRAELSQALGRQLPASFGTVAIGDAAKLQTAQQYMAVFDALVIVLFVLTGLLAVLTIVLARRRVTMVALLAVGALASLVAARLIVNSAADDVATSFASAGPAAIIGGQLVLDVAQSYREFARVILLISLVVAVGATAAAWYLERRDSEAAGEPASIVAAVDGWFLALAGLSVALGALLFVGLTALTLALVVLAYGAWLVVVVRWRRAVARDAPAAGATGA